MLFEWPQQLGSRVEVTESDERFDIVGDESQQRRLVETGGIGMMHERLEASVGGCRVPDRELRQTDGFGRVLDEDRHPDDFCRLHRTARVMPSQFNMSLPHLE